MMVLSSMPLSLSAGSMLRAGLGDLARGRRSGARGCSSRAGPQDRGGELGGGEGGEHQDIERLLDGLPRPSRANPRRRRWASPSSFGNGTPWKFYARGSVSRGGSGRSRGRSGPAAGASPRTAAPAGRSTHGTAHTRRCGPASFVNRVDAAFHFSARHA